MSSTSCNDALLINDDNLMSKLIGFLQILRREKDCRSPSYQIPDDFPHRQTPARIKAGRWFVQEENGRGHDQACRQVQTPTHPSRVGLHKARGGISEIEAFEQGARTPFGHCPREGIKLPEHLYIFITSQRFIDRSILTRQTDMRTYQCCLFHNIHPCNLRAPTVVPD